VVLQRAFCHHRAPFERVAKPLPGDRSAPLIPALQSPEAGGYTPSGFPALRPGISPPSISSCPPGRVGICTPLTPLQEGFPVFMPLYSPARGIVCRAIACAIWTARLTRGAFERAWQHRSRVSSGPAGPPFLWRVLPTPPCNCVQSPRGVGRLPAIGREESAEAQARKIGGVPAGRPRAGFLNSNKAPLNAGGPNPVAEDRWHWLWSHHSPCCWTVGACR